MASAYPPPPPPNYPPEDYNPEALEDVKPATDDMDQTRFKNVELDDHHPKPTTYQAPPPPPESKPFYSQISSPFKSMNFKGKPFIIMRSPAETNSRSKTK